MRVGYLGPAGTYSEEALRASAPAGIEEVPLPTIYDAVMAVHDGDVDRAVVPIENALEGAVSVTLDTLALDATDVRIVAEVVVAPSTSDAVLSVRDSPDPVVALGSRLAAELYGCRILVADVEDHPDNATRFVWLAPAAEADPEAGSKTSVVFWGSGDQSPGWLAHALQELADRGVNLTRIESRPRRTSLGHYMFFIDLEGAAGEPAVAGALEALRSQVEELRVLGSYASLSGSPG